MKFNLGELRGRPQRNHEYPCWERKKVKWIWATGCYKGVRFIELMTATTIKVRQLNAMQSASKTKEHFGITCQILRDHRPDPRDPQSSKRLTANAGEYGVIYARASGQLNVSLYRHDPPASGWIAAKFVKEGVPQDKPVIFVALNSDENVALNKTIWVKTAISEHNMLVFRRPIMKILNDFRPFPGDNFNFLAPPTVRNIVSQAYFSVEVMTNNQRHHAPYARLEQVGPYSNWTQMNNFGMALQYKRSDGQWEKVYYQMRQSLRKPTQSGCARLGYEKAMMIYSMVMQIEYINPPAWMAEILKAPTLRIKEITFDPLTRTMAVKSLNEVTAVQSPTVRAKHDIRNELLAAGLRIANSFSANEHTMRHQCDLCLFNQHEHAITPRCKPNLTEPDPESGSTDCLDCQVLRRPCTRTYAPQLVGPLADAAYGRPPLRTEPFAIAPMELLRFGGDNTNLDDEEVEELRQVRQGLEAAQAEEEHEYDEGAGPE